MSDHADPLATAAGAKVAREFLAKARMPIISDTVHYVEDNGEHLAAIVTKTWGTNLCSLSVFRVGPINDFAVATIARLNRPQDEERKAPGTWHWPERAE